MEYCEDQKWNDYSHSCSTRPQSWCYNQSKLVSLKEIPFSWKEHIFHTGSSSDYKSILENGLWGGGLSLRSTRKACFLSPLNPRESSSRQRTIIDLTGPIHEPNTNTIITQNHDCVGYFNLRHAQNAHLVFQSCSDAVILNDNMLASTLDKVVTFCR